jgi:hypothetical protein
MEDSSIKISNVAFPIIAFSKDNSIHYARQESEITTCTKVSLKNNYFKNLKIIDSEGFIYIIENARKTGTIGPFWGYNILLNQKLKVELLFKNKSKNPIELKELKDKILTAFKKDEYFWNSDGNLEIRKTFIQKAGTHREIITHLTDEFYKKYK